MDLRLFSWARMNDVFKSRVGQFGLVKGIRGVCNRNVLSHKPAAIQIMQHVLKGFVCLAEPTRKNITGIIFEFQNLKQKSPYFLF